MKKALKIVVALFLCIVIAIPAATSTVKADTFVTITLTHDTTVYTRQVYSVELDQIKGASMDTPSLKWVKDTCDHVAFITQNKTKIDSTAVIAAVIPKLLLNSDVNINLSNYILGAAPSSAAANPGAVGMAAPTQVAANPALAGYKYMLSSCTTKYVEGQSRSNNIKVAASRINGIVLSPGQGMSYSTVILPRIKANGYTMGGTISNGQHIQSIGGGICQVSSTLNAAVLKAGIIPTERHNHSEAIGYLKRGLDATVSEGVLDYQFINTLPFPICIAAVAQNGQLTVAIYSNETTAATFDAVVEGGSGSNTTYIVGYVNGVQVSKVKAYSSKYKK